MLSGVNFERSQRQHELVLSSPPEFKMATEAGSSFSFGFAAIIHGRCD